jgi:hypothetical protein
MKQIKLYTLLFLIQFITSGCADWLDGALPKDKNLEEKQFSTESGINSVLNGLYTTLSSSSLYGGRLTVTDLELLAHYYYYEENITAQTAYTYFYNVSRYSYTEKSVLASFSDIWNSAYNLIFRINNFIENVEISTVLPETRRNEVLGEAYGLRAFIHLDLFRIFGDLQGTQGIPYNQSYKVIAHDSLNVAEFSALLLQDIDKAETLLQNDPVRTEGKILDMKGVDYTQYISSTETFTRYFRNFRLNYYAVKALEARTKAFFGNLKDASTVAQTVIDEAFGSGKPFYWTNKSTIADENVKDYIFYHEVLFGVYNLNLYTQWEKYTGGTTRGSAYAVYMENLQSNIFRNDITSGSISLWEDVRAKQWIPSRIGLGQYVSCKFDRFTFSTYNPKEYMQPLIRTGELFYIIAENMIKEGQVQEAMNYLNEFRFHRGAQYSSLPDPASVTEAQAYDILETEYYKEFYGEGQAFFFLKRRGSPKIIDPNERGTKDITTQNYIIPIPESEREY